VLGQMPRLVAYTSSEKRRPIGGPANSTSSTALAISPLIRVEALLVFVFQMPRARSSA